MFILFSATLGVGLSATYFCTTRGDGLECSEKYCGQLDVPLNEHGVQQMKHLREKLEDYSFDLVVTSDLMRVKQSANILSNAKTVRFPALNEMNFGDFEGYTYQEISTKFPKAWNEYCNNWQTALFPNGESFPIFYERVVEVLEVEMEKWQQIDTVLLVGHLGVLRVIALFTKTNYSTILGYRF